MPRPTFKEPVPLIPSSLTAKLADAVGPTLGKVRGVNPAAAKQSATRGAASAKDIATLSIDYIKQETKGPLKGIGRYLGVGAAGAVFIGFGSVMLALALLRGVQSGLAAHHVKRTTEGLVSDNGPLSGSLTWMPYLLTAVACLIGLGIMVMSLRKAKRS